MRGSLPIPSEDPACPCFLGDVGDIGDTDRFVVAVADLGAALSRVAISFSLDCPFHGGIVRKLVQGCGHMFIFSSEGHQG